jgi:hypothetical protein
MGHWIKQSSFEQIHVQIPMRNQTKQIQVLSGEKGQETNQSKLSRTRLYGHQNKPSK